MVERQDYMSKLSMWQDKQIIKVVTGIRRSGKSTLLSMFREGLLAQGVAPEQIVALNFEELGHGDLLDCHRLYDYLLQHLAKGRRTYIFLDEIQKVPEFQKVVDSLYLRPDVDIYITGSNAYLLSGELATLLSGRYVEIRILPLSFKEYSVLRCGGGELFKKYLEQGGFPYLAAISADEEMTRMYLEGIYSTIILKDIEDRNQRRTGVQRSITDLALLKNIARFLADNIGNFVSAKKIADYVTSSGRKVAPDTVEAYVAALREAYVFYSVERFDIKGKNLLKINPKYYIADLGLRNYLVQRKEFDLGYALENVVYFELCRRGYQVNVGKLGDKEVDFVARKGDERLYVQVCANMLDENTFKREMAPLKAIRDDYEKIVFTLDNYSTGNYEGIKVINIINWLLGG